MEMDHELVKDIQSRMILHWNYRNLREFPQELLSHGDHILEIYLKRNNLSSLPNEIGRLKNLTNLYLSGNEISAIPSEIAHLTSLKVLDLSENLLQTLPFGIGKLRGLENLILTHNQLEWLPQEVGHLSNLKFLELSGNGISEITEAVINGLKALEHIGLDGNPIQRLPRGITRLRNLRYISACRSNLLYLPSLPFFYLLNRSRAKGKCTTGYAVPLELDGSLNIRTDNDFQFLFDSNPNLCYFPYWVIQLLGPEVDCHGCASASGENEDIPRLESLKKIREYLKSKTSNPNHKNISNTVSRASSSFSIFSSSKIQLDFKGRKQTLHFDQDLINIHDERFKEPPTLLELGLRAVYNYEILSPPNHHQHRQRNRHLNSKLLTEIDRSPYPYDQTRHHKFNNIPTSQDSQNYQVSKQPQQEDWLVAQNNFAVDNIKDGSGSGFGGCNSSPTPKEIIASGDQDTKNQEDEELSLNNITDPVLLPYNLQEMLDRGPVTKCFECMSPQFTMTRLFVFHHKPKCQRLLMRVEEQDFGRMQRPKEGIVLGCVYFCGDKCLTKFRQSKSKSNLAYGSPDFVLENEIHWQ